MIMLQLFLNHKVQHVIIGTKMHEIITALPLDDEISLGISNLASSLHLPTAKEIPTQRTEILTCREVTLYEVSIGTPS